MFKGFPSCQRDRPSLVNTNTNTNIVDLHIYQAKKHTRLECPFRLHWNMKIYIESNDMSNA